MTMFSITPRSKFSGKIPLCILVTLPWILQTIVVVGLTSYFTFSSGQKTLHMLVAQLQGEISTYIQQYLKTSLAIPPSITQINADKIERGELDFQDITHWQNHLVEQIQLTKSQNNLINSIYVASATGQFMSIRRLEDDSLKQIVTDGTGTSQEYALNKKGHVIHQTKMTSHAYGKTSLESRPQSQPAWSATFNDTQDQNKLYKVFNLPYFSTFSENQPSPPTPHPPTKNLQGILGVGISLENLSKFLSSLKIAQSGIIFIVDHSGFLIATSSSKSYPLEAHKLRVTESEDILIQATTQYLNQHGHSFQELNTTKHQGYFFSNNQRQFFQITPFRDNFNLNWFIVVVIPETNFTEHLQTPLYFTFLLSLVTLFLAISFVMFTSRWIVQPILSLNQAAQFLSQRKVIEPFIQTTWLTPLELLELQQSFNKVAQQFQKSLVSLQTHEEKYHALFDSNNHAVFLLKKNIIIDCNPEALTMFGFSRKEEILGHSLTILSFPYGQSSLQELLTDETPQCFEWKAKRNDETSFEAEMILKRIALEDSYVQAIVRDITKHKTIETERLQLMQQLHESEEYWRTITETVLAGIAIMRFSDGKFIYVNSQMGTMLGLSQEQIINRNSTDFYKNPEERKNMLKAFFRHHGYLKNYELQIQKADHTLLWTTMFMRFLTFNNEKVILTVFYDITEYKRIEEEKSLLIKGLEEMNVTFAQLNTAYERFVPHEFLSYLNKENVVEVNLGDQVEQNMTILFSDIRDFTRISEKLTPIENFEFINLYLGQMEPLIREHHGFIDKYIGDAIMALFPSADHAVKGAIAMLRQLRKYNRLLKTTALQPIEIGIGLNTGRLMLGTVGSPYRMEGTVISDAVNLASRIEGLTKTYHSPLLITEHTYQQLHHLSDYKIRIIDRVLVKGKTQEVTLYEVFDTDLPWIRRLKLRTLFHFEQGVYCFHHNQFQKAKEYFEKVLLLNEGDLIAQKYLIACQKKLVVTGS